MITCTFYIFHRDVDCKLKVLETATRSKTIGTIVDGHEHTTLSSTCTYTCTFSFTVHLHSLRVCCVLPCHVVCRVVARYVLCVVRDQSLGVHCLSLMLCPVVVCCCVLMLLSLRASVGYWSVFVYLVRCPCAV